MNYAMKKERESVCREGRNEISNALDIKQEITIRIQIYMVIM